MPQPNLFKTAVLSVSELTNDIKQLLEGHFMDLKIEGEVSNVKKSVSGHIYFTLKDESAQLSCVVWRSVAERLGTELIDGQQIIAGGDISVYPPHGKYQFIVRTVEQAGAGALQEAYEKLKKQLKTEGLFDAEHKKAVPRFPRKIGVITSAAGAAFHDICDTIKQRWSLAEIVLHHSSVQGVHAAPELVKAIEYFSHSPVDVLIVGRGGGSLEDLWPFNEEAVARAIFACDIPVISAVGHEVDFSISDFVADVRASTPTRAAAVAVPDMNEIQMRVEDLIENLQITMNDHISVHKDKVEKLITSYGFMAFEEKLKVHEKQVESLEERLRHRYKLLLINQKKKLTALTHQLEQRNPNLPLIKGYARVVQEGQWVKRSKQLKEAKKFKVVWSDGTVEVTK